MNQMEKVTVDKTDCFVSFISIFPPPVSTHHSQNCWSFLIIFDHFCCYRNPVSALLCSSGPNGTFTRPINTPVYENILHMKSWFCCRGRPGATVVRTTVKINAVVSTAVATIIHPPSDPIKRLFIISGHNSSAFVPARWCHRPSVVPVVFNWVLQHSCGNTSL